MKDFAEQGFPLLGGRLDYLEGHQVAALIYQRQKHFINVFESPIQDDRAEAEYQLQGFNALSFSKMGMEYWLVSDLNTEEMHQLASLLR